MWAFKAWIIVFAMSGTGQFHDHATATFEQPDYAHCQALQQSMQSANVLGGQVHFVTTACYQEKQ